MSSPLNSFYVVNVIATKCLRSSSRTGGRYEISIYKLAMDFFHFTQMFFFPLSTTRPLHTELDIEEHSACLTRNGDCIFFASTWVHPGFFLGSLLLIFFVFCIEFWFVLFNFTYVSVLSILHCPHVAVVVVIVWWLDLQLPVQSVPITTKVVSSNPIMTLCTRYNIMW